MPNTFAMPIELPAGYSQGWALATRSSSSIFRKFTSFSYVESTGLACLSLQAKYVSLILWKNKVKYVHQTPHQTQNVSQNIAGMINHRLKQQSWQ